MHDEMMNNEMLRNEMIEHMENSPMIEHEKTNSGCH